MNRRPRPLAASCALFAASLAFLLCAQPAHAARIFIDPGHGSIITPGGGVDPGAVAKDSAGTVIAKEKDLALQIAQRLATELGKRGHEVQLYRTGDVTATPVDRMTWLGASDPADSATWQRSETITKGDSLQARCDEANASGADLFISVHLNAADATSATGYETWLTAEDRLGALLASYVQREVIASTPFRDRGTKTEQFYVIRWSHMPAILAECGFISNPTDRAYVTSASGQSTLARAMADGVDAFLASEPYRQLWPRISGTTRYGTAAALSLDGWPTGARTVLLATGENWPDALASAPLSHKLDAPLLLSTPSTLPTDTAEELARLAPDNIVVLGGTGAVSDAVVTAAASAAGVAPRDVRRIAGANRYETAALIATEVGVPTDGRVAVVGGESPADAVSISAYAGANSIPILLTETTRLSTATADFKAANASTWRSTLIIGGTAVVPDAVVSALPSRRRIAGPDRYATNAAVLQQLHTAAGLHYVANGEAYPDCLTAGVRGAKSAGAVMLVQPRTLGNYQRLYIENHETRVRAIRMVGGTRVLPIIHEWMIDKALR